MKNPRAHSRTAWIPALLLLLWAAPAPAADSALTLLSSDDQGLDLILTWNAESITATPEGLRLELPACKLVGESGEPMLPEFHRMFALPPGRRAEIEWNVLESRPIEGEPLPFPTPRRQGGEDDEDVLYREEFIRDEGAYLRRSPIQARLEPISRLRDLRTQSLLVHPISWDPGTGLILATKMRVRVSFHPDISAARETGELPLRRDKLWGSIYSAALLNGKDAEAWRRRVPAKSLADGRSRQTEALITLKVEDSGLQGLSGEDLIAAGLPAGTSFTEIALFRRHFDWDLSDQPDYSEIPVARFFLDADSDGKLDAEDTLAFLGRRLKDQPGSVDPVEWYGRASSYYLALDPSMVLDMEDRSAWQEGGDWTTPQMFDRHFFDMGESDYYNKPLSSYYVSAPYEYWKENLYFFNPYQVTTLTLSVPSPGYLEGSEAHFEMESQGYNTGDSYRTYDMIFTNADEDMTSLPQMQTYSNYTSTYETDLAPGLLADGEGSLFIDRVDESLFRAMMKWWDLEYVSGYEAWNDSILFTNGSETGDLEFEIGRMSRGFEHWILVKSSGELPVHYSLGAVNEEGSAGDYALRFRDHVSEDASWWLVDESKLYTPDIEETVSLAFMNDPGPYDVLVVSHENFIEPMIDRYKPYREAQGYRVKVLSDREVWNAFFDGARGAIGLRNAAKFAYQQWNAESILLVGDCSKDSRALSNYSQPDYMPAHFIHEIVDGVNEVVALDEWIAKFGSSEWPSLLMGRIPASNLDQLDIYLDKLECFESSEPYENCAGDGDWRRRGLMIADDAWSYRDWGGDAEEVYSEHFFRIGQEEALARIDTAIVNDPDWGFPDGFSGEPFFEEVITVPWYEEHSPANSSDIIEFLRPLIWPVFVDSLSQGWLFAMIQSHANRNLLTHESIFDTSSASDHGDHDYVENVGMPFIWAVLGCHGNSFCPYNENSKKDCMGEKLLFLDQNRGAVASYASDGYEFLYPNNTLTDDIMEMLFWTADPEDDTTVFPEWVLGSVLAAAEIRYGSYYSSLRYNILGDPLTRMDAGPPRIRFWLDGVEMSEEDVLTVENADDTLHVRAVITDEAYVKDLAFFDPATGDLSFESRALVDSIGAENSAGARVWELTAEVPFDFDIESLVVEATDLSGRTGRFELSNAKSVSFSIAGGDSLREGQWVRGEGDLEISILVPYDAILPSQFSLRVDGEATGDVAEASEDPLIYRIPYAYQWSAGEHHVEVLLDGHFLYGEINLVVDSRLRLLKGVIFPNPFRNLVLFGYSLTGEAAEGRLKIYTLSGRLIRTIAMDQLGEGTEHWLEWDGLDESGDKVANGTYLIRMVIKKLDGDELVWQDRVVRMR